MATYYVSPSGSNTAPYDTWAKAALLPQTVGSHGDGVSGPHTVYLAPGPYSGRINLTNANWANSQWLAMAVHGSAVLAPWSQVIASQSARINPPTSSYHAINVTVTGVQAHGVEAFGGLGDKNLLNVEAAGFVGSNLYLHDALNQCVKTYNGGVTLNRSRLSGSGHATAHVQFGGSGTNVLNYCVSDMSGTVETAPANLLVLGTATLTVNNSVVIGQRGAGITNGGSGAVVANNTIISGGSNSTGAAPTSGTVTLNNCKTVQNWSSKTGGNIDAPGYVRHQRSGYICLCIDDIDMPDNTGSCQYITDLEALFTQYGVRGDWFVPYQKIMTASGNMTPAERLAFVQGVDGRGVIRVGHHSYSHCNWSLTGNVFAIGASGDTVTVDRTADTITVSGGHTCTVIGFRAKTLTDIRAELIAASVTVGAMTTYIETLSRGEILAGGTGSGPYNTQLLIDTTGATGYFKTEIFDAKSAMETILGRTVDIVAPPFGAVSVDAQTALSAAGFKASRPGSFETRITTSYRLGSFNRFGIPYTGLSSGFKGADAETTRKNVRALCEMIAQTGGVMALLAHETSEFTIAQWEILLQIITEEYPEITATNVETVMDAVENSGLWATTDDVTYTRTWPDLSDYRLQGDSPCIGAGVSITGLHDQSTPATDASGAVVHFLPPSVGAYDGRKTLELSADFSPTGYAVRGTEADPAIIRVISDDVTINTSALTLNEPIVFTGSKPFNVAASQDNHKIKSSGRSGVIDLSGGL